MPTTSNQINGNEMHVAPESTANNQKDVLLSTIPVQQWQVEHVLTWARNNSSCSNNVLLCLEREEIDGQVLMALTEEDIREFRYRLNYNITFSDLKKLWLSVHALQQQHASTRPPLIASDPINRSPRRLISGSNSPLAACNECICESDRLGRDLNGEYENCSPPMSVDGRATNIPPEFFKTAMSIGYSFLVTWITSFVMVIVHERVPDMKKYPPLPDIFLDNVPHIPWAFHMCEVTGTLLFIIWACVCIFHKYRMVLLRRFFALAGTVFLLRCVTMLITSLSVPGAHLQCNQNDYAIDDSGLTLYEALLLRVRRAYTIWAGLGMSIQGVRTCGDYMFSGHTVALTLLNFFITEYTPRNLYFLHTLTWLLNMFGIFFILAAHEHYSIDVFVAFYITSRLFLYYHTLANNQALMSRDSTRTRIWFPMFSYFESSVDGIIPNEYDSIGSLIEKLWQLILSIKNWIILAVTDFWIDPPHMSIATKSWLTVPLSSVTQRNVSTSTSSSICNTPTMQASTTSIGSTAENKKGGAYRRVTLNATNDNAHHQLAS